MEKRSRLQTVPPLTDYGYTSLWGDDLTQIGTRACWEEEEGVSQTLTSEQENGKENRAEGLCPVFIERRKNNHGTRQQDYHTGT